MRVIGINSNLEENKSICNGGSVTFIEDGKIKMAIAEDRISRKKYHGGYENALKYILNQFNLTKKDIDYFCISFYGNSIIPNKDVIEYHINDLGISDCPEKLIVVPSHHFSHAASAYFLSPFNEAIIMVADNEGSILYSKNGKTDGIVGAHCERNSYYMAKGNIITLIERDFESPSKVAFGKAYNKFTEYLGFGSYQNAGKTMGLSSYGKIPKGLENVDLWGIDSNGNLYSNFEESFDSYRDINNFLAKHNVSIPPQDVEKRYELQEYKDLAFYIQEQLNKWGVKKINSLVERTGIRNVCISGGVGLNGVMNATIAKELGVEVFVPPFPSDQGQSLGNAIYAYISKSGYEHNPSIDKLEFNDFTYLGSEFSTENIYNLFCELNIDGKYSIKVSDNVEKDTAKLIEEGKVIGWFQGKSEYGARALGHRSLIADPRTTEMRDRVNIGKKRELFRPLAPSVLAQYVNEYFKESPSLLERYMLGVVEVIPEKIESICGAVHVDNSSRIQSVYEEVTPRYYNLIKEFYNRTGIPMIINTSFNIAGEPIVETPFDAFKSFKNMDLDVLVCEDVIVQK